MNITHTVENTFKNVIKDIIRQNKGIITAEYCRRNNIPLTYLSRLVKEGFLSKTGTGVYVESTTMKDGFLTLQLTYKKVVYSYETALYLLTETEAMPYEWNVSVPRGYKVNKSDRDLTIHYVDKKIAEVGIVEVESPYGNKIKVYNYERTICDFLKNEKKVDPEILIKTLNNYRDYKNKNLSELYIMAIQMKVVKKLQSIIGLISG